MIEFSLRMLPESTTSIGALWGQALPAVVEELGARGYTVDHDGMIKAGDEHGVAQKYRVQPGPATLTAACSKSRGCIQFILEGDRFGRGVGSADVDRVLWMQLVVLGFSLSLNPWMGDFAWSS
jgi:hypothetical protein